MVRFQAIRFRTETHPTQTLPVKGRASNLARSLPSLKGGHSAIGSLPFKGRAGVGMGSAQGYATGTCANCASRRTATEAIG
jgi:hypothetical protein